MKSLPQRNDAAWAMERLSAAEVALKAQAIWDEQGKGGL